MRLLSLLIPWTPDREPYMIHLRKEINHQIEALGLQEEVNVIEFLDNKENTIGYKRNKLVQDADGKYRAFIDSDDMITPNYLALIMPGIHRNVDCCSLWGRIFWSGVEGKRFHHSIAHKEWYENEQYYFRMPNHLNAIKNDLAKDFPFQEKNFGEDALQSYAMRDAGILKEEYQIDEPLYLYFCGFPKHEIKS